jgi:hypothetical protein
MLASARGGDLGDRLREQVLDRSDALHSERVCWTLLSDAEKLPPQQTDALAEATRVLMFEWPDEFVAALPTTSRASLQSAIRAVRPKITNTLEKHYHATSRLAVEEPGTLDDAERAGLESERLQEDPQQTLTTVLRGLLDEGVKEEAQVVLMAMLACDHKEVRTTAESLLDRIGPVDAPELRVAMLDAARRRAVAVWPRWLGSLGERRSAVTEREQETIDRLIVKLWGLAVGDNPPDPAELDAALLSLRNLVGQ